MWQSYARAHSHIHTGDGRAAERTCVRLGERVPSHRGSRGVTAYRKVAELAALRALVPRRAPLLAQYARKGWLRWSAARRRLPERELQRIHLVVPITARADLEVAVGLVQIIGLEALDCSITFDLPTEAAAALFRHHLRRDGLDQLVCVTTGRSVAAIAAELPPSLPVCLIPAHVALAPQFIRELARLLDGGQTLRREDNALSLGTASDLATGARATGGSGDPMGMPLFDLVPQLARSDAAMAFLASFETAVQDLIPPPTPPAPAARLWSGTDDSEAPPEVLEVACPPASDVLVETETADGPQVFFRMAASLAAARGLVDVRPPLTALGRVPRQARVIVTGGGGGSIEDSRLNLQVPPQALEPWMVTAYVNRGGAGNAVVSTFATAIGCELAYAEDAVLPRPGVPVVWGVLRGSKSIIDDAERRGQYAFYIDHAYFARGHGRSYRITRNGFEAGPVRRCPEDRIKGLGVRVKPWRKGGREIICCPPTDHFTEAHGCADWLEKTIASLSCVTDRPVIVRRKPAPGETDVPLAKALKTAHALVTHSSNVAIEAAVLGTPVFVAATSAAAPVGLTDLTQIERPVYPDRDAWLAHLAYNQFSFEEIADGTAWTMLLELEERPIA